jgi:ABC-type branched-subunit amino acid transport system permease subunit
VSSVASAAAGGLFLVYGPEILRRLHVSPQWFNLVTGGLLIVQLIVTPDGLVTDVQQKVRHLLGRKAPTEAREVDLVTQS